MSAASGDVAGQYVKPHRGVVYGIAVLLLVAIIGTFMGYAATQINKTPFARSKYAANAYVKGVKPHQIIDFEFSVRNKTTGPVILRPVTLPRGTSPNLRLLHEDVAPTDRTRDVVGIGWPPPVSSRTLAGLGPTTGVDRVVVRNYEPLDGYRLRAKQTVQIVLAFRPSKPGLYKLGPNVTVHADRVGFWKDVPIVGPVSSLELPEVETACVSLAPPHC